MTLPDVSDREAVAEWLSDDLGLMDDHSNDLRADHPAVRAVQRLVASAVEKEREAIMATAERMCRHRPASICSFVADLRVAIRARKEGA